MAGEGTFTEGLERLQAIVGKGLLHGRVDVDQVYARYQTGWGDLGDGTGDTGVITPTEISHGPRGKPGPSFDHPMGGRAGYLTLTLTEMGPDVAQQWADAITEETPLASLMIQQTEQVAAAVPATAPLELGILRGSGAATVIDNGDVAYERAAEIPRMSQEELDLMRRTGGTRGGLGA